MAEVEVDTTAVAAAVRAEVAAELAAVGEMQVLDSYGTQYTSGGAGGRQGGDRLPSSSAAPEAPSAVVRPEPELQRPGAWPMRSLSVEAWVPAGTSLDAVRDIPAGDSEKLTRRQRVDLLLRQPSYKVIMLTMVSISMAALMHETNQRQNDEELEWWAKTCSRVFLLFAVTDLIMNAFVAGWSFFLNFMNLFEVAIVVGDVAVEMILMCDGSDLSDDLPIKPWLRGLRALRAARGVRTCCTREFNILLRRMLSTLRLVFLAILFAAVALATWSVLLAPLLAGEDPLEVATDCTHDADDDDSGRESCDNLSGFHAIMLAFVYATKDLLELVARSLVVNDSWVISIPGAEEELQVSVTPLFALLATLTILKTTVDVHAEVVATVAAEHLDGERRILGEDQGLRHESCLAELQAMFRSIADLRLAVEPSSEEGDRVPGELEQLRRTALRELACGHLGMPTGDSRAAAGAGVADASGAGLPAAAQASPDTLVPEGSEEQARHAPAQMHGLGRPAAAAAAAAAAAGVELALSAEEVVRVQFAELRMQVEFEVGQRCSMPPPVSDGGGLLEGAALGARRWLKGLHTIDDAVELVPEVTK